VTDDEPAPAAEGPDWRQARWRTPHLFEQDADSDPGPGFVDDPEVDGGDLVPSEIARDEDPDLPDPSRLQVVRHFTRLAHKNVGIDTSLYPLGSCTMKYNPRLGEQLAAEPGVADLHPLVPDDVSQGLLGLLHTLQEDLAEVGGMDEVTLQPAAGAQGELTGLLLARAYHEDNGEDHRTEVIVPDSAHGTNPATASMAGFDVVEIPSDEEGRVDLEALEAAAGEDTAALMLTNPNTLGVFEANVEKVASIVHDAGALLYYDGANLNAIMGAAKPGLMGFDIVHFNLHKTFTTPHGGGGPGAGPVGVKEHLAPYLPTPIVAEDGDGYTLQREREKSIGSVQGFFGNVGVLVRAHAYMRLMGADGLEAVSRRAVLNTNYLKSRVEAIDGFEVPYQDLRKHEFVASADPLRSEKGVRALDVAKRLLDHGIHSPTVYFPQIVDEALMIEPPETEPKEILDTFADALEAIADEPADVLESAPRNTSVARVDEVRANRNPVLKAGDEGEVPLDGPDGDEG
jgi:glycine dehydrogenase subunit 2